MDGIKTSSVKKNKMPVQLTYAIGTEPTPFTEGTTEGILTLMATNNTEQDVQIEGISFLVPVGLDGNELTNEPKQIALSLPSNWKGNGNAATGAYIFVFTPHPAPYTVTVGSSLTIVFSNISVNNKKGTVDLTITEGSTGNPTETKTLDKFPAGWGEVFLTATLPEPPNPGNVTLGWGGPVGADYSIQYFDFDTHQEITIPTPGDPPLCYTGTYPGKSDPPLSIDHTTVFTLNVSEVINGQPYKTQAQQTLQVWVPPPPPEIDSFTGQISGSGGDVQLLLSWCTQNAENVEADWTANTLDANPKTPAVIKPPFKDTYSIIAINGTAESPSKTVNLQWKVMATIPLGGTPSEIAIMPDSSAAIISNPGNGTISMIGLSQLAITQTISGINTPMAIGITPNGKYVCVGDFDNNMLVIDVNSFGTVHSVGMNNDSPGYIVCSPDSQYAWALLSGSILVVNIASGSVVQTIQTGNGPHGMAFTPDGLYVLVVNSNDNTVSVISTAKMQSVKTIGTDLGPTGIAITSDGKWVLTPNMGSTTVSLIDLVQMKSMQNIQVPFWPRRIALAANGAVGVVTTVYPDSPGFSVIDIQKRTSQNFNPGTSNMGGVAITPDSRFAFISYDFNKLAVYDIQKQAIINTITTGNSSGYIDNVAVTPDGRFVLVLNDSDGTVSVIGLGV